MPNGDPNWMKDEYQQLERFFSKIANIITEFAELHNLQISKYYHQSPSWDLLFRHPKGGIGMLAIGKKENGVGLFPCWWRDSYEENLRYSKHGEREIVAVELLTKELLETKFRQITSWDDGDLQPHPAGCNWSKYTTKEKFEAQTNEYPIPTL